MGKELIKSLKTIRDNGQFFERFGWNIIEHGYSLIIYKTHVASTGALIITCSLSVDLDLKMTGFKSLRKIVEMKPNVLTFDKILFELEQLEKANVDVDPVVEPTASTSFQANFQGQSSNDAKTVAAIPSVVVNSEQQLVKQIPKKTTKCTKCNRTFETVAGFRTHMKVVHGPILKCGMCQNRFESVDILDRHAVRCQKKRQSQNVAPGSFEIARRRPLPEIHTCQVCYKQFSSANHLTEHQICHVQEFQGLIRSGGFSSQFFFGSSNSN